MTTAADSATEKAFEAVLAGRPVPTGAPGLGAVTAFTEAVRATATQPGRPNAALAELLANGLILDQPSPSPRTAKRRRRRMWFFTAIIAKVASAGAVAQAATGFGIVLVGFTGAGAAGVLPDSVQHTFATVVSNVTPLTAPDPEQTTETITPTDTTSPTSTSTEATDSTEAADSTETTDSTSAASASDSADKPAGFDCDLGRPFGVCVSEHGKHGALLPGQVSVWAHWYQAHRTDKHGTDADEQETGDATQSAASLSTAPHRSTAPAHHGNGHGQDSHHGNDHDHH